MERADSAATHGASTDTLLRGAAILNEIASNGVVKEELPEDEAELVAELEADSGYIT